MKTALLRVILMESPTSGVGKDKLCYENILKKYQNLHIDLKRRRLFNALQDNFQWQSQDFHLGPAIMGFGTTVQSIRIRDMERSLPPHDMER